MSIQRVIHINAESIVPFLNLGNNYAYYWIKNTGAATIYATTQNTGEKEVSELITDYESGNIINTVKIEPQAAARLFGRTDDMWLYAEEDGLAEIVLDNVAECPFKIQAKGGDANKYTSYDAQSLSYAAYKNGETIFDVETGYYIIPKIVPAAAAGRYEWKAFLYSPDGTEIEVWGCGIQTTEADIVKWEFAGLSVAVNEAHTSATVRGYVKYLSSGSFTSGSSVTSANVLNYFAGNKGYVTGAIPEQG